MNLVKTNTGTQTLSGPNTYTGGTTIKSGTLRMGASNIGTTSGALGPSTAAVTLGDSSGTNSAALLTAGPVTFANAVTVASGSSGTATLGGDTADSSVFSGAITLNKTATLTSANGGNVTFSGVLAGSGTGIIKSGEGTVTLARGNTYTGVTTVKEGTLKLGTNNALADSSKLVLAGGTFSTGGYSDSIDALTNQASSTLTLGTSGTNSITFSSAVRTTGTFSISNWTGIAGQSGTGNRIFISAAPGATFLTNITFTGYHAGAIRLGTGEVVPVLIPRPTKLAITSIEGGASPKPNKPFTVVVQAQDGTSTPWNVTNNTTVTLSLGSGSGSLSGTLTGVILAGNDSVSISGVLYSTAESGIVLTATRTSGDALFAGNSSPFTVSGWQDSSWTRRIAITIDKTKVAGPLTNFPVLISVTNSALQQYARSDGYDLMFTAADGATKLAHEIESYTSSNGVLVAWVNVPILPSTTDTTLYLYFGNSASTNQQDITGTWSPEFKAVWHMNGVFTDSTSNSFNGTNTGTLDASAKMAGGRSFVRANGVDYITAGGLLGTPVNATIGAWIHLSSVDNNGCEIISLGDHLLLRHGTTSIVGIFYDGSWRTFSVNTSLVGTGWRYLAMTFDDAANSQKIYLDGLPIASASYSGSISYAGLGGNTFIGKHGNGLSGYAFDGTMDEVRVAATARSADWIWTEFNNQSATATFYSVGPD